MTQSEKKRCMACMKTCSPLKKGLLKSLVSEHGTMFSSLGNRPNTKFHSVIITKRHVEDLRDMTDQEWADTLPVLKSDVNKIENYYKIKEFMQQAKKKAKGKSYWGEKIK